MEEWCICCVSWEVDKTIVVSGGRLVYLSGVGLWEVYIDDGGRVV